MSTHYPFVLQPLPYQYDALEPYIDEETVMIHHDKHLQAYVDNLNKALSNYKEFQTWTLEELITKREFSPDEIHTSVKNNAGGVYNHNFYFEGLLAPSDNKPTGELEIAINKTFGSINGFLLTLKDVALSQFGSGWAWLVTDKGGNLRIVTTGNQGTPLTMALCPVFAVDVWEHAYYLKYQNHRNDYIDNISPIINWEKAEKNYDKCRQN